jgi:uncharacterized protein YpiB (UPF0302 family)
MLNNELLRTIDESLTMLPERKFANARSILKAASASTTLK